MRNLKLSVVIGVLLIGFFTYYKFSINYPVVKDSESVTAVTIKQGDSVSTIASALKEKGLIRSVTMFKLFVRLNGYSNSLQAGAYDLKPSQATKEIVSQLQHGTFDVRLTFLEGWRVEEMADYLNANGSLGFSSVEFVQLAKEHEGHLFPDTYQVPKYISVRDLIDLMLSNFNAKTSPYQELINSSALTWQEVITFASIVEREAPDPDSQAVVAGILLKRLANEWPLQADATVQYVLGYQTETAKNGEVVGSWWKSELSATDLQVASPYNTRQVPTLPPGPICNPGLSSIEAVLKPKQSEYWYYLSDPDGQMHYAVTLEEHNANIARYLR